MKKLIAILLCISMLCAFAGCGAEKPAETTEATDVAVPVGTVVATLGSTVFELVYDSEGVALELKGGNEAGDQIAANCQQYVNRACVHGIRGLMRYCSDNNLIGDAKTFSIRVRHGDPLPEETFLETIVTDTQYLADEECTGVRMVMLDETRLTGEGLIDEDTAAYMGALYLQVDVTEVSVGQLGEDHIYTVTGGDMSCTVNADTGLVQG